MSSWRNRRAPSLPDNAELVAPAWLWLLNAPPPKWLLTISLWILFKCDHFANFTGIFSFDTTIFFVFSYIIWEFTAFPGTPSDLLRVAWMEITDQLKQLIWALPQLRMLPFISIKYWFANVLTDTHNKFPHNYLLSVKKRCVTVIMFEPISEKKELECLICLRCVMEIEGTWILKSDISRNLFMFERENIMRIYIIQLWLC